MKVTVRGRRIYRKTMVGVAQRLEHWTVTPGVGGSNPLAHPIFSFSTSRSKRSGIQYLHPESIPFNNTERLVKPFAGAF